MAKGDFMKAQGVIPWKEGDELPEQIIRRMRDKYIWGPLPWKQAAKKWRKKAESWQWGYAAAIKEQLDERERWLVADRDATRRLGLLEEYDSLLKAIMSSYKGSIGTIDNVYLPQLDKKNIDKRYSELEKELKDGK